jgi:hypothetical protein
MVFMPEYNIEFYKERPNKEGFVFYVEANNIEEAALKAKEETEIRGVAIDSDTNARIVCPKGKNYEILKEGVWLIDSKTGKRLSDLEEKLSENQ